MKRRIEIHSDLVNRLKMAAANGSKVCADILKAYAKRPTTTGNANYFTSVRVKSDSCLRVKITMCNKDIYHKNFPEKGKPNVQWESKYRCECGLPDLMKAVKLNPDNYASAEIQYAVSALCVTTKIKLILEKTQAGIQQAYDSNNYCQYRQNPEMPLHGSCMRHENTANIAADFYKNVCGANILVAKGEDGCIYGRAIVWPRLECNFFNYVEYPPALDELSLMDRIYYSHEFIQAMFKQWAQKNVDAYKTNNDYYHKEEITLTDTNQKLSATLMLSIPQVKWHQYGAPYVDTMTYIFYHAEGEQLYLLNAEHYDDMYYLGRCDSTIGTAAISEYICPSCGRITSFRNACDTCMEEQTVDIEGIGKTVLSVKKYKDKYYPASYFENGKPKRTFEINHILHKLARNTNY